MRPTLNALPACPIRFRVSVSPITANPARVRTFMPKRVSFSEHCLCPWSVAVASCLGCQLTAFARPSHRVHSPRAPGLPDLWGTEKAAERWIAKNLQRLIVI